jgi:hypothetical protein
MTNPIPAGAGFQTLPPDVLDLICKANAGVLNLNLY